MKFVRVIAFVLLMASLVFAQTNDVAEFRGKIGFTGDEDYIAKHIFLDEGKKLLIIGGKSFQMWDLNGLKLIKSAPHQIASPSSFHVWKALLTDNTYYGNAKWQPSIVDEENGRMITSEKVGNSKLHSAIVRDLKTFEQLAVWTLPNASVVHIAYDSAKSEYLTFGEADKLGVFATWDKNDLKQKSILSVDEYKWHYPIRHGAKLIVGSGETKVAWGSFTEKHGDKLTLRDAKTGAIEKEFTAPNLEPRTSFFTTTVSKDEKYLISRRNERIFVWEIDGGGQPKFEVSRRDAKEDFSIRDIAEERFIVTKSDGKIRIYDVQGDGTPRLEAVPQNASENLHFRGIYENRFAVIASDGVLRIYDLNGDAKPKIEVYSANPKDTVSIVAATTDSKLIAIADDQKVSVWNLHGVNKLYEIQRESEKERLNLVGFINEKGLLPVERKNKAEKKPPRTEYYDLETGGIVLVNDFIFNSPPKFSPNSDFIYAESLGRFEFWNVSTKQLHTIPIKTEDSAEQDDPTWTPSYSYNIESVEFNSDFRYLVRHGSNLVRLYDSATGSQVQILFDRDRLKRDRKNVIKSSGLNEVIWSKDGKSLYGFTHNAVNCWELIK